MFKGRHAKSPNDVLILKFEATDAIAANDYVTQTCEALCSTGRYGFYSNSVPTVAKLRVMAESTKKALADARDKTKHSKGLPPAAKAAQQAK
jgi:hypothetical protein